MHPCPKDDCGALVADVQFACKRHWWRIPKPLRDAIWTGYRAQDRKAHGQAMVEAKRLLNEVEPSVESQVALL